MQSQEQRSIEVEDVESQEEEQNTRSGQKMEEAEEEKIPYEIPNFKLRSPSEAYVSALSYVEFRTEYEEPEIKEPEMSGLIPDVSLMESRSVSTSETHVNTSFEDVSIEYPDVSMYTEVVVDIALHPERVSEKKDIVLDTEMENELSSESEEGQEPLLEEILELMDGSPYFPRGRTEIGNGPLAILIGEDEKPWHEPVLYMLRELFREITESFPAIHFRKPSDIDEITEDMIDSTEPHSLEKFRFDNRIELLDARESAYGIEEFFNSLQNRFEASYLQRFGLFVIAVKKSDVYEVKSYPSMEKMRVITIEPNDENFDLFCRSIFGLDDLEKTDFRKIMSEYTRHLSETVRKYSVFVKQGGLSENDREHEQYSYKVAVFEYLVKDDVIKNRGEEAKKKYFYNLVKFAEYVSEIMFNKEARKSKIMVEEPLENHPEVIPDIIYEKDGEKTYVEFETLIGTLEPMKKVDHSIEKYTENGMAKISKDDEIWIVLRPVSAIVHMKELKSRLKIYKKIYKDKFHVEIKVLCRENNEWVLKSLDRFEKSIRPLIKNPESKEKKEE